MSESLFNKVTDLYPATLLKEKTPMQVFSDEFCKIHEIRFYRTPPGDFFYTKIYFTTKIVKSPLEKEKKWKQLVRKTTKHAEKKLT